MKNLRNFFMKVRRCAFIFIVPLIGCQNTEGQDKSTAARAHSNRTIAKLGISNDRISKEWRDAIESRMTEEMLDSIFALRRLLTNEEKAWVKLIESRTKQWNAYRDSLEAPFGDCHTPDTVYVLMGFTGVDDGFTYRYNTVCFDLTAFQANYGEASLPENGDRCDRIFAHEFTHLLHKEWVRKNKFELKSFKDSILWECLYEGIGMYRSLTKKWLPKNGVVPEMTKTALDELYPVFVEKLTAVESHPILSENEKRKIRANLSRGRVEKKWGAFTVAIWLSLEANGDDKKLAYWIDQGINSIVPLAQKYLTGENKTKFNQVFKTMSSR
jgi:hypothetical protein